MKCSGEDIWKDIAQYEGLYQVSNRGAVRSLDRWIHSKRGQIYLVRGKTLTPSVDKDGYLFVHLWKGNGRITRRVHRLVAEAFLPNPCELPEVNHKNETKNDNAVSNLEWCDRQYNATYGTAIDRRVMHTAPERNGRRPVSQFTKDGILVRVWGSAAEAATSLNANRSDITKVAKGKAKSCRGYKWEYAQRI